MARESGQLQAVAKSILTPFFRFGWRIQTEGLEKVPETGGALIAPNHTSVLDSFFVPLVLPRRITYVGKAEYLDDWKTKVLFPAMGMIPIDRSGGDASQRALDASARVLEAGELFGIYPEGTRSRTGTLHKGHTGVARLALRTGCPIVPVGICGARDVQPPDAKLPRPFMDVVIRFGDPIDVSRYCDRANDRLVLRQITDEVMYEIRNLSGQMYVDSYATKRHESIPTEPALVTPRVDVVESAAPTEVAPEPPHAPSGEPAPAPTAEAVAEPTAEAAPERDDRGLGEQRSSAEVLQHRPLVDLLNL